MKSIQKRIYNVLPRVAGSSAATSPMSSAATHSQSRARSNSLSSSNRPFHTASSSISPLNFFDTPPPPSSRPSIPSPSRLPVETKPAEIESPPHSTQGQSSQTHVSHPPLSSALTQPQSNGSNTLVGNAHGPSGHPSLFSYSLASVPNLHTETSPAAYTPQQHVQAKKQKPKYQLYVGAYGIPKKCAPPGTPLRKRPIPLRFQNEEDMGLAVQVGEDAYFIRDNAMGVADGVGGWAKVKPRETSLRPSSAIPQQSPSALFARRLMHYCSSEVDILSACSPLPSQPIRPPRPHFTLSYPTSRPTPTSILMPHASPWQWSEPPLFSTSFPSSSLPSSPSAVPAGLQSSKDAMSALEENLEESLEELSEGVDVLHILERAYDLTLKAHVVPAEQSSPNVSRSPSPTFQTCPPPGGQLPSKPIHIPNTPSRPRTGSFSKSPKIEMVPLMSGSSTALLAVLDHVPRSEMGQSMSSSATLPSISTTNLETADGYHAVIKIAHVGDCMGMLVRGEEIVWRSEEMWWNFNTPVQLGPSTPTTPRTSAHVFTLPVLADDILILATDGLSDNLWDEDVLDEAVRFRRSFLGTQDREGAAPVLTAAERVLRRRTLAGMLSEALCSRARRVSERKHSDLPQQCSNTANEGTGSVVANEVPFARRAREAGKTFRGGKNDDISVIVAVISPAADLVEKTPL